MHTPVMLGVCAALLAVSVPALPAHGDPGAADPPQLLQFARTAAPVGHEAELLDEIEAQLPQRARTARDAFGSLLVRLDGGPLAAGDGADRGARLLVAVGVDEPCFVVSRIREDGYLRLRYLGGPPPGGEHLLREGRPARVWTRAGPRPGVVLVDSIHLRNPRPELLDESQLWLDVGADSAADVAALDIELLDPVEQREVTGYGLGAVAGEALGRRAAAHALLALLHELPASAADGVCFAFVAQSLPGAGPLGRGGEALLRRVRPSAVLALSARGGLDMASARRAESVDGVPFVVLDLRVAHEGTPVETVAETDLAVYASALRSELTGGPTANPKPPATAPAPEPASEPAEGGR
jgi:putative aminopeptidase FrvX